MKKNILRLFILPVVGLAMFSGLLAMEASGSQKVVLTMNGKYVTLNSHLDLATNASTTAKNATVFTKIDLADSKFTLQQLNGQYLTAARREPFWVTAAGRTHSNVSEWQAIEQSMGSFKLRCPFFSNASQHYAISARSQLIAENRAATFAIEDAPEKEPVSAQSPPAPSSSPLRSGSDSHDESISGDPSAVSTSPASGEEPPVDVKKPLSKEEIAALIEQKKKPESLRAFLETVSPAHRATIAKAFKVKRFKIKSEKVAAMRNVMDESREQLWRDIGRDNSWIEENKERVQEALKGHVSRYMKALRAKIYKRKERAQAEVQTVLHRRKIDLGRSEHKIQILLQNSPQFTATQLTALLAPKASESGVDEGKLALLKEAVKQLQLKLTAISAALLRLKAPMQGESPAESPAESPTEPPSAL